MTPFLRNLLVFFIIGLFLQACAPRIYEKGTVSVEPELQAGQIITPDGRSLPLKKWAPGDTAPKAIILALHGFNDYSNFFDEPGRFFADQGILSYAYDQRGFGETEGRGYWHGSEVLVEDLKIATNLIRAEYPGLDFYLLGESMGGAVIIKAMTAENAPETSGLILSAPAVWGRETMSWYHRWTLWVVSHTMPGLKLTGRGLNIKPSDNRDMLIQLGKDPLVIKETRVDAIKGLVDLMDDALANAPALTAPSLILYGQNDEIIPKEATANVFSNLISKQTRSPDRLSRLAFYNDGYHMLLRDLQARTVLADIASWITQPDQPLPSGADKKASALIATGQNTVFTDKN